MGSDDSFDLYDSPGEGDGFVLDLDDSFTQNFFTTSKAKKKETPSNHSEELPAPSSDVVNSKDARNDSKSSDLSHTKPSSTSRNVGNERKTASDSTTPHGSHASSVTLDKLPWWTTDVELEEMLTAEGIRWKEMTFHDTKNGKIGAVQIDFDSQSQATSALQLFDGKKVNGSLCEATFTNHSSGRHGPSRQSSRSREERINQNGPYYRASSSDRRHNEASSSRHSSSSRSSLSRGNEDEQRDTKRQNIEPVRAPRGDSRYREREAYRQSHSARPRDPSPRWEEPERIQAKRRDTEPRRGSRERQGHREERSTQPRERDRNSRERERTDKHRERNLDRERERGNQRERGKDNSTRRTYK